MSLDFEATTKPTDDKYQLGVDATRRQWNNSFFHKEESLAVDGIGIHQSSAFIGLSDERIEEFDAPGASQLDDWSTALYVELKKLPERTFSDEAFLQHPETFYLDASRDPTGAVDYRGSNQGSSPSSQDTTSTPGLTDVSPFSSPGAEVEETTTDQELDDDGPTCDDEFDWGDERTGVRINIGEHDQPDEEAGIVEEITAVIAEGFLAEIGGDYDSDAQEVEVEVVETDVFDTVRAGSTEEESDDEGTEASDDEGVRVPITVRIGDSNSSEDDATSFPVPVPTAVDIRSKTRKSDAPSASLSAPPGPSSPSRRKRKAPLSWSATRKPPVKKARKLTRAQPYRDSGSDADPDSDSADKVSEYGDEKGNLGQVTKTTNKLHSLVDFQKIWEQPRDWLYKGNGKAFKTRKDDPPWVFTILSFLEPIFAPNKARLPRTISRLPICHDKVRRSDDQYVWLYVGKGWEALSGPNLDNMQKREVPFKNYIFAGKPLNYVLYESLRAENIGVQDYAELQMLLPVDGKRCAFPDSECRRVNPKGWRPRTGKDLRGYLRHLKTHYNVLGYHNYCAADNAPNREDNFGRHAQTCAGAWIIGGTESKKLFDQNRWLILKKTPSTVELAKEQATKIDQLGEAEKWKLPEDVLTHLRWQQLLRLKEEFEAAVRNRTK